MLVLMIVIMTAAALTLLVIMVVMAAPALLTLAVMVSAAALALLMVMMVVTAAALLIPVVMMSAAALALLVVMMVVSAAALSVMVMVMMAAATATAAAVMTGQRNGLERSFGGRHRETDVLEQALELIVERQGKASLGLSNANAASGERIDRLLHQIHVAGDLEDGLDASLDDVETAALVDEHVIDFERTGLAKGVFKFGTGNGREGRRRLHALIKRQNNLVGAGKKSRSGNGFKRKKLGDFHDFMVDSVLKRLAF